jgi:hypothetical protein
MERQTVVISGPLAERLKVVLAGTCEVEQLAHKKIKSEDSRQAREQGETGSGTRSRGQQSPSPGPARRSPTSPDRPPPASTGAPHEIRDSTCDIRDQQLTPAESTQEQSPRSGDSSPRHMPRSVSRPSTPISPKTAPRRIRKTYGMRIRDPHEGAKISEEPGYWPTDAHASDASLTDDVRNNTVQRPGQPGKQDASRDLDESHHQSRQNRHSYANGTPPSTSPEGSQTGSPKSAKSGDESPGPWRAAPPFGGGGGRRRPPRHRPNTSQE